MNKTELKRILKEEIRKILREGTSEPQRILKPIEKPHKPDRETITIDPNTKPMVKPKRRTLAPPEETPDKRPAKAEQSLVDKITSRFKKLSK